MSLNLKKNEFELVDEILYTQKKMIVQHTKTEPISYTRIKSSWQNGILYALNGEKMKEIKIHQNGIAIQEKKNYNFIQY